ncbi:MAG: hypothetical protein AB6733_02250 [Clostridiaceae bacterium]
MLKLTILELVFRVIPEEFLLIFSIYVFSFTKIDIKRLFTSGIILSIIVYLIRFLPIQPGVHTLILIPIILLISRLINKITVIKGISAAILSAIFMNICEMINSFIVSDIFRLDIRVVFGEVSTKLTYGSISLISYLLITLSVYFTIYKNKKR